MPQPWVLDYYRRAAPYILPFLHGRKVGLRQQFSDGQIIFRRHEEHDPNRWITIDSEKRLLYWVHRDAWAFFPHIQADDGELWFAMDIDQRKMPLPLTTLVAAEAARLLEELGLPYLLKFSGQHGFHFMWTFGQVTEPDFEPWSFERNLIRFLRNQVEDRLQHSPLRDRFYQHLHPDDPITILNAQDRSHPRSVLIDELILKDKATFRAPYSLHIHSGLASVPLAPARLADFDPARDADPSHVQFRHLTLPHVPVEQVHRILPRANEGS